MLKHKKIKTGGKTLEAIVFKISSKNLIVIKGKKGYIMCGYLNLKAAEKFGDIALIVKGVSNIEDVLSSKVAALTKQAKKLGLYKNQPIKDALKTLA